VVTNLLSNAVKYGRGNPIQLLTETVEDRVRLSVKDGGIGIAAEDLTRLFNRFERAVSERNYGGFGLGLWISRQIVEAMGGRIHVTSQPGVGSTFTVELPRPSD
jgi:signal transduction histidine kinase